MRKRLNIRGNWTVGLVLSSLLVLDLTGCGLISRRHQDNGTEVKVVAMANNTGALALTADDIVTIMRECGFTDQQIYYNGGDLREALLNMGGAKISIGNRVEAMFKVQSSLVWIACTRGTMLYDAKSGRMQLGPPTPQQR